MSAEQRLINADMRNHNLGVVLTYLGLSGRVSRSEIAANTGLTRGAVTSLTGELLRAALIRPVEPVEPVDSYSQREVGRPREELEIDGAHVVMVAVQLEAETIRIRAANLRQEVLFDRTFDHSTVRREPWAVVQRLACCITECSDEVTRPGRLIAGVTVTTTAPVMTDPEIIPMSLDLGWGEVDLHTLLSEELPDYPGGVVVANAAKIAAYAEFTALRSLPETKEVTDIVYITMDQGIGGGAIIDSQIVQGPNGLAFVPGHMVVELEGQPCDCGKKGCLVTVAGAGALLRESGLEDYRSSHGTRYAFAELMARLREGEPRAVAAVESALPYLSMVMANALNAFQPQFIVLGGYLREFHAELMTLPPAPGGFARLRAQGHPRVLRAVYGEDSVVQGALGAMRDRILRSPTVLFT